MDISPSASESRSVRKEQKDTALVRASRVANLVNLSRVRFVQFAVQSHSEAHVDRLAEVVPDSIRFTRPRIERSGSEFVATSVFTASVGRTDGGVIATLRATVALTYEQHDETDAIEDEDLREFAAVNVPFNSWGYWREFVQSSLARLGLPAMVIPLFRVQVAREWMLEEDA